ncbi:MAG: tetratricopeptide repeat protein, partial [Candidatus Thermoplasmatota archaeon]|nr:tetratricopeptide repeat protein [Candidatus Thermoplasmatota archaeon]
MSKEDMQKKLDEAQAFFKEYDFDAAHDYYREALDILNKDGAMRNKNLWIHAYKGIIESLDRGGKWLRALEYAGILISDAKMKGDKKLEIEVRLMSCGILLRHGNWEEAKKRYEATLELAEKNRSPSEIAECQYGLAYIDWRKGEMRSAKARNKKALDLVSGTDSTLLQGKARILMGSIEDAMGNAQDAITFYKEAIDILEPIDSGEELARVYNNLGEVYKGLEDYASASDNYEKCVEVSKKVRSKRGELYGMSNIAECQAFLGRVDEAKKIVAKVEALLKEAQEKYILAQVPFIYGIIAYQEKRYSSAPEQFEKAIENLHKMGAPPYDLGIVHYWLGMSLKATGKLDEAHCVFERAKR